MTNTTQSNVKNKYIKFSRENKSMLFSINNELYNEFFDEFKKSKISFIKFINDDNDFFMCFFQISTHDTSYYENMMQCIYQHLFNDFYDENNVQHEKNIQKIIVSRVQL